MTPFIWKDRMVKIEDGAFWLSAKGKHDDFNVGARGPDVAMAGQPSVKVNSLEIGEDGELLINGRWKLSGENLKDFVIRDMDERGG